MPLRLTAADAGFGEAFAAYMAKEREAAADVTAVVAAIIADVRGRGDAAVVEYTQGSGGS